MIDTEKSITKTLEFENEELKIKIEELKGIVNEKTASENELTSKYKLLQEKISIDKNQNFYIQFDENLETGLII